MNLPLSLAPGFSRVSASQTSGNRFNGLRRTWQAMTILLALWVGGLTASSEVYETNGLKLDVSLRFDKPEFMLGEPTWFTLEVQNHSSFDLQIIVGGDYRNDVGRPDSFKIKFVGADGKPVPQPTVQIHMGGLSGLEKLPAKGKYAFRLFVPHWATFGEPGNYSVTCARRLAVGKAGEPFTSTVPVDVQAKAEVRVVAADSKKFGELIESLERQVFSGNSKEEEKEAARKILTSLNDVRVVPILNKEAACGDYGRMIMAVWALGKFRNDEAFDGLKRAMHLTGKDIRNPLTRSDEDSAALAGGIRHSAANALARCNHPQAIPFLLKFHDDENQGVRVAILHVLGKMDTVESLALLQQMSHDKSELVGKEANRYINLRAKQK